MAYTPDISKYGDGGLNLNAPPDLVPKMQYSRLTNAVSKVEGTLQQRDGMIEIVDVSTAAIVTLFRLNQQMPNIQSERLVGTADGALFMITQTIIPSPPPPAPPPFPVIPTTFDPNTFDPLAFDV